VRSSAQDDTGKRAETALDGVRSRNERLEAFSDGVFAIAITLLILSVPVPHSVPVHTSLAQAVGAHWADFLAYGVSFLTILVMWMNHHSIFQFAVRHDRPFVILNGLLLLLVTFVNYPTALVATFLNTPDQRFALALYSATLVAISIVYNALWHYGITSGRLVAQPIQPAVARTITRQYYSGLLLYAIALVLALISGWASLILNAALAIFFAFTGYFQRQDPITASPVAPDAAESGRPL
jgi:uncharacterized membrane protein